MGCAVGDYDGDGRPDLFLTGYRQCALYHNEGGRRLVDVTRRAGIDGSLWTTSAAFADVDRDSRLDLYVGAYVHTTSEAETRALTAPCGLPADRKPMRRSAAGSTGTREGGGFRMSRGAPGSTRRQARPGA